MVSRRSLLGFLTTGATASLVTWFAVGEDPPVSVDVDVDDSVVPDTGTGTDTDAAGATGEDSTDPETSTPTPEPEPEPTLDIADAATQLRERINELRQEERDMDPLTQSSCAAQKAQAHAESMATNGYFSHTGRDGTTQTERYAPCGGGGENAAKTYVNTEIVTANGDTRTIETTADLVDSLMTQWMTSREHREKGIFGDWSAAGGGIARDGTEIYAVTGFIL